MRLLLSFARAYPWQSGATLLALLVAGLVEGIGLSTLLPVLSSAIDSGTGAAAPQSGSGLTRFVPDALSAIGIRPTLGPLLAVMVLGLACKSVLVLLAYKQVGYTIAHVATDLRLALIRALLAVRWEYFLHERIGGLANAAGTEAIRASQAYYYGARSVAYLMQALVYAGVALAVSWKATAASLMAGAALLYLFNRLVRATKRAGLRQTKLLKSLLARLTDSLLSVKPLKSMARENLVAPLLEAETQGLDKALRREVLSKEVMRAVQEPTLAALVAVGLYAALVRWSVPPAVVLALVFLLARTLYQLGMVQRMYQTMVAGESAYWSLQDTIREAELGREIDSGTLVPDLQRAIRLANVGFSYGDTRVLADASLVLPAGVFSAVIGASGSGKTTLVDLITGLLRPQRGEIWIDDAPLSRVSLRAWRRMIGYVPQETGLLHDTVLHNVTLADPQFTEADAVAALRAAGAWSFVATMPLGIHHVVGERGAKLSGGQRQRIVIARALVHKPRLLILDEATSALDEETEMAIYRTLRELHPGPTILAISHRPSVEAIADRVYRLQSGIATLVVDRGDSPAATVEAPRRELRAGGAVEQ
jgi:ATP-binding cassette subfamily C protein